MKCARIEGLEQYRRTGPDLGIRFGNLPSHLRPLAERHLRRLVERWRHRPDGLRPDRYARLVAVASSLATHPRDSAWGRRMLAKRGGYAVQERYRQEGRDPLARANRVQEARSARRAENAALPVHRSVSQPQGDLRGVGDLGPLWHPASRPARPAEPRPANDDSPFADW